MAAAAPNIGALPVSVDFIDNRLSSYHDAFRQSQSHFDPRLGRYMPDPPAGRDGTPEEAEGLEVDTLRQAQSSISSMSFWTPVFPLSMSRLKELHPDRPDDRVKSAVDYGLREARSWDHVYAQLQAARERYDGSTRGAWGRKCKNGLRWIVDHSAPGKQAIKLVPSTEYVSPVLAAVEVILDACQIAANIRTQAKAAFKPEDLERRFGDIEIFLATFKNDATMEKAAVDLVAATLRAIENAIGFFLKNDFRKALSVLAKGKNYQHELIESISNVEAKSAELIHHAQNSHIRGTKQALDQVLAVTASLPQIVHAAVATVHNKMDAFNDQSRRRDAESKNMLKDIFDLGERNLLFTHEMKQELERKFDIIARKLEEQESELQELRAITPRAPTPTPRQQPLTFPQQQMLQPSYSLYPSMRQQQQQPLLPWTTPFPPPLLQGMPVTQPARLILDTAAIRRLINMTDIDIADLNTAIEDRYRIVANERARAKAVAGTRQFRRWVVTPESRELLVHGGTLGSRGYDEFSALSVLCADVTRALRKRRGGRYVSLVFFCGRHAEEDEMPGGETIVRSFVHQLLRQRSFDGSGLDDVGGIAGGGLDSLCNLFCKLVRLLPAETIVICIIDGISAYETDELEDGMLVVLRAVLGLARDGDLSAVVKVLATSPGRTDAVQRAFRTDEDCFLSMAQLRSVGKSRVSGLGGDASSNDESDGDVDDDSESEEEEDADDG
ncbi:hypothetical protein RB595_007279 [Gaeumannomyces hyphopodioides]